MKTAFEILQSKLTIADTSEFRLIHIPEILYAMEEYKTQLPQQEISDEKIFKQSVLAMEERYGSGCNEEIDAYFRGAIWYREQLKQL